MEFNFCVNKNKTFSYKEIGKSYIYWKLPLRKKPYLSLSYCFKY